MGEANHVKNIMSWNAYTMRQEKHQTLWDISTIQGADTHTVYLAHTRTFKFIQKWMKHLLRSHHKISIVLDAGIINQKSLQNNGHCSPRGWHRMCAGPPRTQSSMTGFKIRCHRRGTRRGKLAPGEKQLLQRKGSKLRQGAMKQQLLGCECWYNACI